MSESRYRRVFERLRAKWTDSGILAPAVADNTQIAEFEQRYRVVLPEDLRVYFATVNGTVEGRLGMDDDDLIGFWHLDQVRTFAEEELADIPDASTIFAFADQSIHVYTYGVRLSDDAAAPTPVLATVGSSHVVVSPSFVEFIERYLHGDRSAIYPVSGAFANMAVEMHTNLPLISAGDCSVCRDAGDVVFVRKRASDEFFFVCPDCGCAWPEPPTPDVVDTIDPPEALAPQGWMIATRGEILTAGLHSLIRRKSPFDLSVFEDYAGFSKRTNS